MSTQAAAKPPTFMTVEEFLAWDGGGHVGKLELVDGVVRAMAPASATHAIIQLNIGSAITSHLRNRNSPCRAGTEAPIIPPMGKRANARAPDVAVTCTPPSDSPTFEEPVLIAEVISPTNEAETWESIRTLAGLPSLQEILVVKSTRIETQQFRRGDGGAWPSDPELAGAGGTVRLASIDLDLQVAELYRGTALSGT
jgi:Uma2 family endonuclease